MIRQESYSNTIEHGSRYLLPGLGKHGSWLLMLPMLLFLSCIFWNKCNVIFYIEGIIGILEALLGLSAIVLCLVAYSIWFESKWDDRWVLDISKVHLIPKVYIILTLIKFIFMIFHCLIDSNAALEIPLELCFIVPLYYSMKDIEQEREAFG